MTAHQSTRDSPAQRKQRFVAVFLRHHLFELVALLVRYHPPELVEFLVGIRTSCIKDVICMVFRPE